MRNTVSKWNKENEIEKCSCPPLSISPSLSFPETQARKPVEDVSCGREEQRWQGGAEMAG